MPQIVQQQIAKPQITCGLWDKCRQRHTWRPVFTVPGGYEVEVTYFNKDREDLLPPQLGNMPYRQLSVPERMDILLGIPLKLTMCSGAMLEQIGAI